MHHSKSIFRTGFILVAFLCIHGITQATEIVRFNLDYFDSTSGTVIGHTLDIELFDDTTPLTAANFLNYVNAGKYDGLLVNRSQFNFIIQTGRYTFRPDDPGNFLRPIEEGTGLELVPLEASSPIKSEFNLTSITNIRGTLAMALLSHDPDSATNEWFINLSDNSQNLDNQNGGFTVFGRLIDNGIDFADEISLFPILAVAVDVLGPDFADLPVADPPPFGSGILQENLIMVSSAISSISRPILIFTPGFNPLPLDVAGDATGSLQLFTLTNTGNNTLTIIPIVNTLTSEFTIETDNCSGITLDPVSITPASSCDISIRFIAQTESVITDGLYINYFFNTDNYIKTLSITAEGVPTIAVLDVNRTSLAYLQTDLSATRSKTVTIKNKGGTNLTINTITSDNTDYTFDSADCVAATVLVLDATCELIISFAPTTLGTILGNITISTSAGDAGIQLGGVGVNPEILVSDTIDYGTLLLSQTIFQSLAVVNNGDTGLLLTTFEITGPDEDMFTFTSNCPDSALNASGFCLIDVTFTPTSTGTKTATLTINSNDANNPQSTVSLIANVADLNTSDGSIVFANTVVGDPATEHVLTLNNLGGGLITINSISISGTNSNLFSFDNNGCIVGSTLNSCDLTVSFTPVTVGSSFTADLIIETTAINVTIPLSGAGIPRIVISDANINIVSTLYDGSSSNHQLTITNQGINVVTINAISITGTNSSLFSFDNADCTAGSTLTNCILTISFTPISLNNFTATLVIITSEGDITIPILGNVLASKIVAPEEISFGTSQLNGLDANKILVLENIGSNNLIVTDVTLTGLNGSEFTIFNTCPTTVPNEVDLDASLQCQIGISLEGLTLGSKTASLVLTTNDPVNPIFTVKLTGETDNDTDGVPSAVERLAENNGDGNNDNIADEFQNNVASISINLDSGISAVTLVTDKGILSKKDTVFTDVNVLDEIPPSFPVDEFFGLKAHSFTIFSELTGDVLDVGVFLPIDINVRKYYRFGPTPDNPESHLYDFTFNNDTGVGAQILGQVTIVTSAGKEFAGNLVLIRLVDGGLGDDDLTLNGKIVTGAAGFSIARTSSNNSSGGVMSNALLLIISLLLPLIRKKYSRHNQF